jgi:hypothetical protein
MQTLDAVYWENRYENHDTGWDAGAPTKPLTDYLNQLKDKNIRILIPGAGNAYEAEYAFRSGFKNVFVLEFAEKPIKDFLQRCPAFPKENIIHEDFFLHKGQYDLILEQTFFCAIPPSRRAEYAKKCKELLIPKTGKLAGVLFDRSFEGGPPFGGSKAEYEALFSRENFEIVYLAPCYNSIAPRSGSEVFILLRRKVFDAE